MERLLQRLRLTSASSILGLGLCVLGGGLLFGREDTAQADPAPTPRHARAAARGAPCPVTWQVFAQTANVIGTFDPDACPNLGCETPFGQNEEFVTDLDGDGTEELVTLSEPYAGCATSLVAVALRRSEGKLRIETLFGGQPLDIPFADADDWVVGTACIDVTGDRLPDLVIKIERVGQNDGEGILAYFENMLPPPSARSAADVNGDGEVDAFDLSMVLAAWGPVK